MYIDKKLLITGLVVALAVALGMWLFTNVLNPATNATVGGIRQAVEDIPANKARSHLENEIIGGLGIAKVEEIEEISREEIIEDAYSKYGLGEKINEVDIAVLDASEEQQQEQFHFKVLVSIEGLGETYYYYSVIPNPDGHGLICQYCTEEH